MKRGDMKRPILITLIIILSIVLLLIVSCVRPILPGTCVEIVYPAPEATVPTEFSVLGVAAKWSIGIEVEPILFLGAPKRFVGLPPSAVELTVDGSPYALSSGGNHHVFRLTLPVGDHTLGMKTPFGNTEITVHVADDPPVRFTRFGKTEEYEVTVDRIRSALYDYIQGASPPAPQEEGIYSYQKIYLTDDGAFILFGKLKNQLISVCEVRYVAPIGAGLSAGDIARAPVILAWDAAAQERPVKIDAVENGGDRLFLAAFDDETLTIFSVFPDGSVARSDFPLSGIAPGLSESITTTFSATIRTKANRDILFIALDTYQMKGAPGHFDILVAGDTPRTVDLAGKNVDGITPGGDLVTLYPAAFVGPFDSALVGDTGPISGYLPLPDADAAFSFTGGYVHLTDEFFPEYPRFEIGPLVPCPGCTKDYVPPNYNVSGDVTFGPDVLKTTLGGREEYFIMEQ